jgi:hypothetical protein
MHIIHNWSEFVPQGSVDYAVDIGTRDGLRSKHLSTLSRFQTFEFLGIDIHDEHFSNSMTYFLADWKHPPTFANYVEILFPGPQLIEDLTVGGYSSQVIHMMRPGSILHYISETIEKYSSARDMHNEFLGQGLVPLSRDESQNLFTDLGLKVGMNSGTTIGRITTHLLRPFLPEFDLEQEGEVYSWNDCFGLNTSFSDITDYCMQIAKGKYKPLEVLGFVLKKP